MKERIELIRQILTMHNFFVKEFMVKKFGPNAIDSLFNMDLLDLKPDRFYLVEQLQESNTDYENKTFIPRVEVRYHLRSQEAAKYGNKHQAYYDRYLSTISFSYDDINDIEAWKKDLLSQFQEFDAFKANT